MAIVSIMPLPLHMVLSGIMREEHAAAGLAAEPRGPVIQGIHMLISSTLRGEAPVASLTILPMFVLIEVIYEIVPIVEIFGAVVALEHRGENERRGTTWCNFESIPGVGFILPQST
jgi:hypothetical protein